MTKSQELIVQVCDEVKERLLDKNRKYGDAALNPMQVFSSSEPLEQINVRMDDKISRIKNAQADDEEDAEFDLLGYLMLKMVARGLHQEKPTSFNEAMDALRNPLKFKEGTDSPPMKGADVHPMWKDEPHLLTKLFEECSEIIQMVSKIQLFGLYDVYEGVSNQDRLETEVAHALAVIQLLCDIGTISKNNMDDMFVEKVTKMMHWWEYSQRGKTT